MKGADFMKECFVICPIGESGSNTRDRSDKLLERVIEPVCKKLGYAVPVRCDKIFDVDRIDQTVFHYLKNADLVVADVTEDNPNVFLELGYRMSIGKPYALLIECPDNEPMRKLPFDIANLRAIKYSFSDISEIKNIKSNLEKTIKTLESKKGVFDIEDPKCFEIFEFINLDKYLEKLK